MQAAEEGSASATCSVERAEGLRVRSTTGTVEGVRTGRVAVRYLATFP